MSLLIIIVLTIFLIIINRKCEFCGEPKTFCLGNCTYTPDFYIPKWNCYIEIKGYWRNDTKYKFYKFKRIYSNINIYLFYKNKLKTLGILND